MQETCSHALTPKKPQKKANPSLCSVSLSLMHTVTAAVVTFPLEPGFCCLAFGEGHLDWLVEARVVLGDGSGHNFHYFLPPSC